MNIKAFEQLAKEMEPHCLSEKAKQQLADLLIQIKGDKAFLEMTQSGKKPKT